MLELPLVFVGAWLLPRPRWRVAATAYVSLRVRGRAPRHRHLEQLLRRRLPANEAARVAGLAVELEVNRYLHYLEIARQYRPGASLPPIQVIGISHLVEALRGGNGAILLVGHFVHNGLAPKVALAEAGHAVTHVSRREHGFSKTFFGIHFLNPVRRRVEDRFLRERVLFGDRPSVQAGRKLVAALAANQVVSITVGAWEGSRILEIPLMGTTYPVASGAFSLAHLSGAPILPVMALQSETSGVTSVIIEPRVETATARDREGGVFRMATAAVNRFVPYIEGHPGQFRGWSYLADR